MTRISIISFLLLGVLLSCQKDADIQTTNWDGYQGGDDRNQYSHLDQINLKNVSNLSLAWSYKSGDADPQNRSQIQCNPLIIDGVLYGSNPALKLFALDAATGQEKWTFDPFGGGYNLFGMGVNRGMAWWAKGQQKRILYAAGSSLFSINPVNGQADPDFGENGAVDLHKGLGEDAANRFVVANSPGAVFEDLYILGTRVSEQSDAAPGYIRAFDIKTGVIQWTFHTIPKPGEAGHETWPQNAWKEVGGANAWSGMSLDAERGIVYVPTGSAAFDFYGGDRHGENLFANCVLALDAKTGKRIWHYQTVHHDLWDRDLPAPPNLVRLKMDGKMVDAVAQITKSGLIFVLDRDTGQPLFPVEEVPVPASDLAGEAAWPTQPIPTLPPAFSRNSFAETDITNRSPEAHAYVKAIWQSSLKGKPFIPPSKEGTIIFPGFDGGGEWGGAAVDPNGIMYVNASEMPWILQMIEVEPPADLRLASQGKQLFQQACVSCHGVDLKGASVFPVPSLVNLKARLDEATVMETIRKGRGQMPSFSFLKPDKLKALTAYLLESDEKAVNPLEKDDNPVFKHPFVNTGYIRFKDQDGYPAITPPWGNLNAIDLNTGQILWKVPLGEYPELSAQGIPITGTENYGGPLVTAGGLIFIAATKDERIRAFRQTDGEEVWSYQLPAGGYATPATYSINGKQYVVIAAGGGKVETASGDQWLAFALPD
ncbi:MAG: PQQ-binding-like beta-propeller repeat protein [Bacteroidota bacterium]